MKNTTRANLLHVLEKTEDVCKYKFSNETVLGLLEMAVDGSGGDIGMMCVLFESRLLVHYGLVQQAISVGGRYCV